MQDADALTTHRTNLEYLWNTFHFPGAYSHSELCEHLPVAIGTVTIATEDRYGNPQHRTLSLQEFMELLQRHRTHKIEDEEAATLRRLAENIDSRLRQSRESLDAPKGRYSQSRPADSDQHANWSSIFSGGNFGSEA